MSPLWGWSLSLASCAGLWVVGLKKRAGWFVILGSEALWFAYAILAHQYGLMLGNTVYCVIAVRNIRAWRTSRE